MVLLIQTIYRTITLEVAFGALFVFRFCFAIKKEFYKFCKRGLEQEYPKHFQNGFSLKLYTSEKMRPNEL